ncbi:MAG: isochorismatase family protein [Chloroflexota bacterium]
MADRKHVWEDVIDDEIRAIAGNYASRMGLKDRPALLCVDNYNAVFGDKPEPVLEAMKRFPSSCGQAAWSAVEPTKRLLAAAREAGIPVAHTTALAELPEVVRRAQTTKRTNSGQDRAWDYTHFSELAPLPGEIVIRKLRATGFFGTPLNAYFTELGINSVVVCGNSTSGCVRATAVDAYNAGYKVAVVEDCVFDRNWLSHKVNLFDLNCKYADVMFVDEALDYLSDLP